MRKSARSRRLTARIAVAGALAVIPLAAVAGPALADTITPAPSASPVDWPDRDWHHGWDHGGDWHHDWHHGGDHGWMPGGWNPGGWNQGGWMPPGLGDLPTGSAG